MLFVRNMIQHNIGSHDCIKRETMYSNHRNILPLNLKSQMRRPIVNTLKSIQQDWKKKKYYQVKWLISKVK